METPPPLSPLHSTFASKIERWYAHHGRELPWRDIQDPYRIWISEVILQQTRVAQGYDYYLRFITAFPDVFALAAAEEDEVLRLWQGLGYYSRARNLHAAAKSIAEKGAFPTTYEEVRQLKGVGDYTAAAICSFAYDLPHAVVDGNVYRVLSRVFGIDTPIDTTEGKKEYAILATQLLNKNNPGLYNQALMDFGALQCTPLSPSCSSCPFLTSCVAYATQQVETLPVKSKRTAVKDRYFTYFYLHTSSHLFLYRRPSGDIWQGLYEPLLIEKTRADATEEVLQVLSQRVSLEQAQLRLVVQDVKHVLTHRRLHADCYLLTLPDDTPCPEGAIAVPLADRDEYAVPTLVAKLYKKIDTLLF